MRKKVREAKTVIPTVRVTPLCLQKIFANCATGNFSERPNCAYNEKKYYLIFKQFTNSCVLPACCRCVLACMC